MEKEFYSCIYGDNILKKIDSIAHAIREYIGIDTVEPMKDYKYEILHESILFDEKEFIETICENILNNKIEKLSLEIVGFDYTKDALSLKDVLSNAYNKLTSNDIIKFSKEIMIEIEKYSDMVYYELNFYHRVPTERSLELFGESGLSWYFKTESYLTKDEILDECMFSADYCAHYDVLDAKLFIDDIKEISREEFYSCTY